MILCPAGSNSYTVRPGDSLWAIAQRFRTTVSAITTANPGLNINNLLIGQTLCIPSGPMQPSSPFFRKDEQALHDHMRLLWTQHVYWTRRVLLGLVFDLPDTNAATARLFRNPSDFKSILKLFYGDGIAGDFAELFASHLALAAELVRAAKAGNHAAAADAEARWYQNADQIAAFLGSINPYWSAIEWQKMLYDHLAMTKTEAVDLLTQKYEDSIALLEHIEREALVMADRMTQGIAKQFSQYFK